MKKANGGLGFCDMIFKAKYFPIGDFLKATLGSNPSFTWQSVFPSLLLLKQGIHWRIGNATQIDF